MPVSVPVAVLAGALAMAFTSAEVFCAVLLAFGQLESPHDKKEAQL